MWAHNLFIARIAERNRLAMKQCMDQTQTYTVQHQVKALGCVSAKWQGLVKKWMTELKMAVQGTEAERMEMRTVGNPLMGILDEFEFYEPTQPSVQSLVIEEVAAEEGGGRERSDKEKGDDLEEVDEEIRIDEPVAAVVEQAGPSRSDKGKQKVVEESAPAETNPEKEPIYLEQLVTTIPADELQFNLSQTFE